MIEPKASPADLRSLHTSNFPEILNQLNISLVVSTYQAGKLILLREQDGGMNTHFRNFPHPMGLAVKDKQLAIGSRHRILREQNGLSYQSVRLSAFCNKTQILAFTIFSQSLRIL